MMDVFSEIDIATFNAISLTICKKLQNLNWHYKYSLQYVNYKFNLTSKIYNLEQFIVFYFLKYYFRLVWFVQTRMNFS